MQANGTDSSWSNRRDISESHTGLNIVASFVSALPRPQTLKTPHWDNGQISGRREHISGRREHACLFAGQNECWRGTSLVVQWIRLCSQCTHCNQVQVPQLLSMHAATGEVRPLQRRPRGAKRKKRCWRVHAPGSNSQLMTDGSWCINIPTLPFLNWFDFEAYSFFFKDTLAIPCIWNLNVHFQVMGVSKKPCKEN